jgi:hypothetical protein
MMRTIEISIETNDGVADCMIELDDDSCTVTILYPNVVNGFSRSEVYTHDLVKDEEGLYRFSSMEDIHPKIAKLEEQIMESIPKDN